MTDNRMSADTSPTSEGNDYLSELIRSVSADLQGDAARGDPPDIDKPRSPDMISSLLSNPELLSRLPAIIAAVKPIMEIMGSGMLGGADSSRDARAAAQMGQQRSTPVGANPSSLSLLSGAPRGGGSSASAAPHDPPKGGDRRSQLLCALKPYLCEDRQRAIDYVIKLDRLGDVLKSL